MRPPRVLGANVRFRPEAAIRGYQQGQGGPDLVSAQVWIPLPLCDAAENSSAELFPLMTTLTAAPLA